MEGERGATWQSSSSTKTHTVSGEHIWTVTNYEERFMSAKNEDMIFSDEFSVWRDTQSGREKITFKMEASFNGKEGNVSEVGHFGTFLRRCLQHEDEEEMTEVRAKFQFIILDKNGGHCLKSPQGNKLFLTTSWGFLKAFTNPSIMSRKGDILSDGSLKILCSFEVLCDYPQNSLQAILAMDIKMDSNKDTLKSGFTNLLNSGELSDVELVCKGVPLKCHKLVLAARSDVFKAMFSHEETKEKQTSMVNIVDSTPDCVLEMVNFMYTDDCIYMKEHALGLLPLADKYNISRLKLKCEDWLAHNVSVANVSKILCLADMHNSDELFTVAQNFAVLHMDTVKHTDDWKLLKEKHPGIMGRILETLSIPTVLQSQVKNRPGPKCKRQKHS